MLSCNRVQDTFTKILKEVCTDVRTERLISIEADVNRDIKGESA